MEITQKSLSHSESTLLSLEFVIRRTSEFLQRFDIHKSSAISLANRSIFLSWPVERLKKITETTEKILAIHLEAAQSSNFDFDDSSGLLNVALRSISMSIDPSFYTLIKRNDILEVYDNNHIQIFRSFNFFRICNYNLDDILAHEWFELYERDQSATEKLMGEVVAHLQCNKTVSKFQYGQHLMRERFSEPQTAFAMHFKYIASAYGGPEKKLAFVCTCEAKPLKAEENLDFIRSNTPQFKNP